MSNLKNNAKARGFTIVELLVVIVVIGILAAITIVSYSGITDRANTKANMSNANSVIQAAQIVYANTSAYPAASANAVAALNASDAKIPGTLEVSNAVMAAGDTIRYIVNAAGTGFCVGYWDYTANAAAFLYGGVATTDSNGGTTAASCTP